MDVLDRNKKQKIITSSVVSTLVVGAVGMTIVLIAAASQVSNVTTQIVKKAAIGPVGLFEISKRPLEAGGYEGSIKFLSGQAVYWALIILAAGALAYFRVNKKPAYHK